MMTYFKREAEPLERMKKKNRQAQVRNLVANIERNHFKTIL